MSGKNWTVAYRKHRANRFLRYSGLATDWGSARDFAAELTRKFPELEVWYTTTALYDATHDDEDSFNILVESGRRVRVVETDNLPTATVGV